MTKCDNRNIEASPTGYRVQAGMLLPGPPLFWMICSTWMSNERTIFRRIGELADETAELDKVLSVQ